MDYISKEERMKKVNEVKASHFVLGSHHEPYSRDASKIGSKLVQNSNEYANT
jgi:hypothetical protein